MKHEICLILDHHILILVHCIYMKDTTRLGELAVILQILTRLSMMHYPVFTQKYYVL